MSGGSGGLVITFAKGSAAVLSAAVIASGMVTAALVTEILTPAQMDEALKKRPVCRAPGS